MFGSIGGPEIIFVFVLALLLFGPRKLPEIGRTIGRTLAEFKRATSEFTTSLEREVQVDKLKQTKDSVSALANEARDAVGEIRRLGRSPTSILGNLGEPDTSPPRSAQADEESSSRRERTTGPPPTDAERTPES